MKQNSVLKLHGEIVCAPLDLWLARIAGGDNERGVHFYVGDRYWRLAEHYERRGWIKTAKRFRLQAEHHLRLSGWNDLSTGSSCVHEHSSSADFHQGHWLALP
jgi:hypothetical protein